MHSREQVTNYHLKKRMLNVLSADSASAQTYHTIFGRLYNRAPRHRDRIMPTMLGLEYYNVVSNYPHNYRNYYRTPPIVTPDTQYQGLFAIADLQPVDRPLPWDRIGR
jgi:hypothetical protein